VRHDEVGRRPESAVFVGLGGAFSTTDRRRPGVGVAAQHAKHGPFLVRCSPALRRDSSALIRRNQYCMTDSIFRRDQRHPRRGVADYRLGDGLSNTLGSAPTGTFAMAR